jgi:hypothetical protein
MSNISIIYYVSTAPAGRSGRCIIGVTAHGGRILPAGGKIFPTGVTLYDAGALTRIR